MSGCAARRFGPGVPCTKPTLVSSEMEETYKAYLEQRNEFSSSLSPPLPANALNGTITTMIVPKNSQSEKIQIPVYGTKTRGF